MKKDIKGLQKHEKKKPSWLNGKVDIARIYPDPPPMATWKSAVNNAGWRRRLRRNSWQVGMMDSNWQFF